MESSANVEQSAATELKSDTEDIKPKTKKGRDQKVKKNKGDKKDQHATGSIADESTINGDTRNKPEEPKQIKSTQLTVDQLIEKYQGKHIEKQRKH